MKQSFGKLHGSMFTGSMMGAGSHVIAVMCYAIANARPPEGRVELNPKLLSVLIGDEELRINQAIEFLLSPDPKSRSKIEEGRRIIRLGEFEYRLVNWLSYRQDDESEDIRAAWASYKAKQRASKCLDMSGQCPDSSASASASASEETQGGSEGGGAAEDQPERPRRGFTPPTKEELDLQAEKIGLPGREVEKFVNHFETVGWTVGRSGKKMKSWIAALNTWKSNWEDWNKGAGQVSTVSNSVNNRVPKATTIWELTQQKQAHEIQLKSLRDRGFEDAMGFKYASDEDRKRALEIKERISEITNKIANVPT